MHNVWSDIFVLKLIYENITSRKLLFAGDLRLGILGKRCNLKISNITDVEEYKMSWGVSQAVVPWDLWLTLEPGHIVDGCIENDTDTQLGLMLKKPGGYSQDDVDIFEDMLGLAWQDCWSYYRLANTLHNTNRQAFNYFMDHSIVHEKCYLYES